MIDRTSPPMTIRIRAAQRIAAAIVVAWAIGLIEVASLGAAEPPATRDLHSPVAYRRVFVPAENVDAWPRDGEKFLPVDAKDFDAWVAAANGGVSDGAAAVTIDAAEYTGRLDASGRLVGTGSWNISFRGQVPAILPLGELSVVVREPRWQSAKDHPARLGYWADSGNEANRPGLEVRRSDILIFKWSAPASTARDTFEIPWKVPAAITSRLILELPEGKEPTIDGGIVLESRATAPDVSDGKPRRRWVIALAAGTNAALRIASPDHGSTHSARELTLREDCSYRVEQNGLSITAAWRLEGDIDRERELNIPLPRGTQMESITADGRELPWRITRGGAATTDVAIVQLPETGGRRSLRLALTAWSPLILDRSWQLPILRPDGVFWSSGSLDLAVADMFELRALTPLESAQTNTSQFGPTATGLETYSVQLFSPTASVEVAIARRKPDVAVRAGSSLILADPDVTGRLVAEWNVARSSVHRLSGEIAAGWNIETVETIPADAMAEWFIERRGKSQHIEVQLTDAASPVRKVTIILMGRLQRFSLAAPISAETMRMVKWSGAREIQHLLTFQSTEPFAVDSVGDLPTLPRDSITDADRALLDGVVNDSQIVELTRAGQDAGLQLTFKRGQYSADVELDATLAKNELRQTYRITAEPKANPVDRLLVYATMPLGDNTRWTKGDATLIANLLPLDDPQRKDLPKEGELWLLRLPQATTDKIEIRATISTPCVKRVAVPLLALPEAVEQRGRVVVRSNNGGVVAVEPVVLQPTPLPTLEPSEGRVEEASPVRAAFRFKSVDCLAAVHTPRLWIGPGADSGVNPLVARSVDLESFYWPDGRGVHRATYDIDNFGAIDFKPSLATDAKIASITVNGQTLESLPQGEGSAAAIRLPPLSRSAIVSIYFITQQEPLRAGRSVAPPVLQNGIPLLAGQWTIWLPEEYSIQSANPSADTEFNWQQRIFGPLARARGAPTFQPQRAADWARLVNSIADWRGPAATPAADEQLRTPSYTPTSPLMSSQNDAANLTTALGAMAKQGGLPAPLSGWQPFHETFVADGTPSPITILHPAAVGAWAIAVLLACLVLGQRLGSGRGNVMLILLTAAASSALLLPAAFAPLATGVFWGLVGAVLIVSIRTSPARCTPMPMRGGRAAIAGILTVAAIVGLAKFALADPANAGSDNVVQTPIERVLIPVDSSRHPTGSRYYLSERFLRNLLGSSPQSSAAGNRWLLRAASYAGELAENRGRAEIAAGTWSLKFEIETLARNTTVVLPLARDEASWQPTAMLDGVPVPIEWTTNGRKCVIKIDQPGEYSLTIYCVPETETVDGGSQFTLSIPPLISAGIQIRAPEQLAGVTVANAALAQPTKDAPGNLSGELALADHLTIRWPRLETKTGASQGLAVTELNWLNAGVDGIELQTKYVVEGGARRPEKLSITHDDRWQWLTETDSPSSRADRNETGGAKSVQIALPASDVDRQEVVLRWKMKDAAPAGNIRLPSIELASIPTTQRWFALTADPSLECALLDNVAPEATSKEFLSKWGASASGAPQIVLANANPIGDFEFSVRPTEAEPVVREVLHVAASNAALRVVYQANISPGNQFRFQYRVTAPAGLNIEGITLNSGDRKIPVRWTADGEGHINVFFDDAATDSRLTLTGSLPIETGASVALPRITGASMASATQQVQIYRDDDVQLSLSGLPPAEESNGGPNELPPVQWLVRQLGVYHLNDAVAKAARVKVEPSRPRLTGDTLTTLTRESETWWATYRCRLVVEKGEVDTLRFRIPSTWIGPFDVESTISAASSVAPFDELRQTLTIRFSSTIAEGGPIDLRIRAPLAFPSGAPATVPNITLPAIAAAHHYLLIPNSLDAKRIAWTEADVREAEIPNKLLPASADTEKQRQLEVAKMPFQVSIRTESTPRATPRIRLADTIVSTGERGGQLISTRFILASDGLPKCILRLPADQELISITLDGHAALANSAGDSEWNVALGAAQLPQSLEIVSRTSAHDADAGPRKATGPVLVAGQKPIDPELSLWSFARPRHAPPNTIVGASPVSAADQAALRFDRLVSIAESATVAAADAPGLDGENWSKPWAAMLNDAKNQAQRILAQPTTPTTVTQVSRSSEEQIGRATKRLDEWLRQTGNVAASSTDTPPDSTANTARLVSSGPHPFGEDQQLTCYVADGSADRLTLSAGPSAISTVQIQVVGLLLIAGVASVGAYLVRSPLAADFLCRWAHAVGILIGIAYWAWLWPSWLGLVIAAASLWLALRFNWPGRSVRPEASTVMRSTRSS